MFPKINLDGIIEQLGLEDVKGMMPALQDMNRDLKMLLIGIGDLLAVENRGTAEEKRWRAIKDLVEDE